MGGFFSREKLIRIGALALFAALALGCSVIYLKSAHGAGLASDISSIFSRAVSGIFNGGISGERFIGAVSLGNDDSEPPVPKPTSQANSNIAVQSVPTGTQNKAEKININTADIILLQDIPRVGAVTAQSIIDHRNANGPFYEIADIKNVSGIGEAKFEKMKDLITVGNVVPPPPAASEAPASATEPIPEPTSSTPMPAPVEPSSESQSPANEPSPPESEQTPEQVEPSPQPVQYANVLISEIMVGASGNSAYEFIELYNPTNSPVDLSGWTIRRINSNGTELSLLTSVRWNEFAQNKTILPGKHFLMANAEGYTGSTAPDITWAKSNILSANYSIIVYDSSGTVIETISWTDIPADNSFERDSWDLASFHVQSAPTPTGSQN